MVWFNAKWVILVSLFLMVLLGISKVTVLGANETDALNAIGVVRDRIISCHLAVTKADSVGANITVLLLKLHSAGELLSKAELSFENGDFNSAFSLSGESQSMLTNFVDEAKALTDEAVQMNYLDFLINVVGSITAACVVAICSFVVWWKLKKRRH